MFLIMIEFSGIWLTPRGVKCKLSNLKDFLVFHKNPLHCLFFEHISKNQSKKYEVALVDQRGKNV